MRLAQGNYSPKRGDYIWHEVKTAHQPARNKDKRIALVETQCGLIQYRSRADILMGRQGHEVTCEKCKKAVK